MVYLLKMLIFHGYISQNQMVGTLIPHDSAEIDSNNICVNFFAAVSDGHCEEMNSSHPAASSCSPVDPLVSSLPGSPVQQGRSCAGLVNCTALFCAISGTQKRGAHHFSKPCPYDVEIFGEIFQLLKDVHQTIIEPFSNCTVLQLFEILLRLQCVTHGCHGTKRACLQTVMRVCFAFSKSYMQTCPSPNCFRVVTSIEHQEEPSIMGEITNAVLQLEEC